MSLKNKVLIWFSVLAINAVQFQGAHLNQAVLLDIYTAITATSSLIWQYDPRWHSDLRWKHIWKGPCQTLGCIRSHAYTKAWTQRIFSAFLPQSFQSSPPPNKTKHKPCSWRPGNQQKSCSWTWREMWSLHLISGDSPSPAVPSAVPCYFKTFPLLFPNTDLAFEIKSNKQNKNAIFTSIISFFSGVGSPSSVRQCMCLDIFFCSICSSQFWQYYKALL